MSGFKAAAVGIAVVASTGAMAADATFQNHMMSSTMVSPAQLWQYNQTRTDMGLTYASAESSDKPEGMSASTTDFTGTNIAVAGVYNTGVAGLQTGMSVTYMSSKIKGTYYGVSEEKFDFDGELSETTFSPQAAYSFGSIVAGAALDVIKEANKFDDDSEERQYTTFRPGVLFHNDMMEAGVAYTAPNRMAKEESDELEINNPAIVTVHGRFAVNSEFTAGAILTNSNYKAIDEDSLKDEMNIRGTGEFRMGATKIEGQVGYTTDSYKAKENMNNANIGGMLLGAAADYAVNANTTVGGGMDYTTGSDKNDAMTFDNSSLLLTVRGNMMF